MTKITGTLTEELERLQAEYLEMPGFRAVLFDGQGPAVIVDRATLATWEERLAGTGIKVAPSCVSESLITAGTEAVESQKLGEGGMASSGYNALTDTVDVETSNELDTVRALDSALAGNASDRTVAAAKDSGNLRMRVMTEGPGRVGRFNDLSPFRGGARIQIAPTYGDCSTGVYINSPAFGTVMVTAGHCGENGDLVVNGDITSQVGTIEGNLFPDPDLALIDGRNYNPRSFAANNNTTIKEVTASGEPVVGNTYCQFGATSKRVCYEYDQLFTTYCDSAACTHLLAHSLSGCGTCHHGLDGDSGGGVFAEKTDGTLSFRGIKVAEECGASACAGFDHKRSALVSHYDANIMTP